MADDEKQPIIFKKVKKVEGGHHGGAWKVAYADFVTAMMAFFLMLWLLNASTEEQLVGIAEYFRPTSVSESTSGSGGIMGGTSLTEEGALRTDSSPMNVNINMVGEVEDEPEGEQPMTSDDPDDMRPEGVELSEDEVELIADEVERRQAEMEEQMLKQAEADLRQAIEDVPELQNLSEHLLIDMTPEGLRIQIVDQHGRSMFPLGKASMYDDTYLLLAKIAQVIERLPNKISVRGHTDGVPYSAGADYNNWDLSTDRANASRRALVRAGLSDGRIRNVVGKADTEHLFPDDPASPQNRRISIILLRDHNYFPDLGQSGGSGGNAPSPSGTGN